MINSLQHVGQGVWDINVTFEFYKRFFGYKVKLNDLTTLDEDMAPIIGSVETLRSLMAMNVKGGGILELIEHKSSPIRPYPKDRGYGNYGILEVGYSVRCIDDIVADFREQGVRLLTPVCEVPLVNERRWRCAYLQDPDGMRLQLVEDIRPGKPMHKKPEVRGIVHVGVGVSDLERSKEFYRSALGFDRLVYSFEGHIPEMDSITGGPLQMKLAILERSAPVTGAINILPAGTIKLIEVPGYPGRHIYKGRRWGDIGCMEFCMDVTDLESTIAEIKAKDINVYLSQVEIDMGYGSKGMVAYIRDPDGTIVELVEIKTVAWVSASTFMRLAMPLLRLYHR